MYTIQHAENNNEKNMAIKNANQHNVKDICTITAT